MANKNKHIAALLLLLAALLAFGSVSFAEETVDIASAGDTVLKLYRYRAEDSTPFELGNMFPGDSFTKSYFVQISYRGQLTLHFTAKVRSGYEKLAEVLKCRIAIRGGDELYNGLIKDVPAQIDHILPQSRGTKAEVVYDITAYLDTSVGNEYMNKELFADFRWWVEAEEGGYYEDDNKNPAGGELIFFPTTGDNTFDALMIAAVCVILAAAMLILIKKRNKKEGNYER